MTRQPSDSPVAHETVTRRRLLQVGLTTGAAGILGSFRLATAPAKAWAASPRPGGVLKMAYASSPRTIDPALAVQADEYMITQNIYDNHAEHLRQSRPHR
jgi:ABC-type transport system substrate-binding protein